MRKKRKFIREKFDVSTYEFQKNGECYCAKPQKFIDKTWIKWYIYGQKHGGVPCSHWYGDTRKTYNEAVMVIVKAERFSVGRRLTMRISNKAEKEKANLPNRHGASLFLYV